MKVVWKSLYTGIRAREHLTRKHGMKPDLYFVLRYRVDGMAKQEALGWSSEGWTLVKARVELAKLKEAKRTGQGEVTLQEKRAKAKQKREVEKLEQHLTLQYIFENDYMAAQHNKGKNALKAEKQLMKNHIVPFFGNTP